MTKQKKNVYVKTTNACTYVAPDLSKFSFASQRENHHASLATTGGRADVRRREDRNGRKEQKEGYTTQSHSFASSSTYTSAAHVRA